MRMRSLIGIMVVAMALLAAACSGGSTATTTATTAATTATTAATTATTTATTATTEATTTTVPAKPIMVGAAIDLTSFMAPFDAPAALAGKLIFDDTNAAGGVDGRQFKFVQTDTQAVAEQYKAAATGDVADGASVIWVTCDVDIATPAIQVGLEAGLLTVAPCIGTDQMGPKRFGEAGNLAFSFGNEAQDEGAAMAEYAIGQGWKTAVIVRDNMLVYFQNVVDAFKQRFVELGGEIVLEENFTNGDGTIGNVASSVANTQADVVAISTSFNDLPGFVTADRSLADNKPILCSWACDGAYWVPKDLSNFYYVTYASVFGDDPSPEVTDLIARMDAAGSKPTTGGFVGGADAAKAIAAAIEATGGTDGQALAGFLENLKNFPGVAGPISFSKDTHTVFGRPYRVIRITNGEHAVVDVLSATSPATIP
ncbi:MAG: amino acid ABC transporter substrate-binding protein [Actinobacteria bacterium]|nr:amino acid ABC transporter substrate-binding protein [Actinomycetota bacterium]